jgi:hypothetical protein
LVASLAQTRWSQRMSTAENRVMRHENEEHVLEQSRAWLLRSRRWAERGLELLASTEEADLLTDHEKAAEMAEALQAVVDVTQPSQVWSIESKAQLLALIELVELLLRKGNLRHLN